jgi:phage tail protein E|nr:MAG TPA: tail assembly chaperone protein [Caudoviricetes sp.]
MKSNQSIQINDDNTVTVILSNGDRLTLREPLGKDMDGLSQDLIKIKHTDQVQKLLGRISTPQLTRLQYGKLGIADTQVLNTALDFFSAPPSARAEFEAALTELGYLPASASEPTTAQPS